MTILSGFDVGFGVGFDVCLIVCFDVCFDLWFDVCFDLWFDVCFDLWFDVCFDVCFNVYFNVCFDVCRNVGLNVCFEDLITEMEPSLSVYVSICWLLCACVYTPCSLMCDWVRKPAFNGVLSYKTAACFNLDQCATLNLTFSTGILRLKCRSWNGSLTVPNKNQMT